MSDAWRVPHLAFSVDDVQHRQNMVVLQGFLTDLEGRIVQAAETDLTSHIADPDPHSQYLTATEGNASYAAIGHLHDGTYAPAVHAHDDLYYTEGETDVLLDGKSDTDHLHTGVYDPFGSAAAAVSTHEGEVDPHPQYLTQDEGDLAYLGLTAKAADADKLDGLDSTAYALEGHAHEGAGTDGLAPASSPPPTLDGGPGFLVVTWEPIVNADFVTYEVHLGTASGFTPTAGTLVGLTPGTGFVTTVADAAGNPVVYGATYYAKIVAFDDDGAAAASSASPAGSPQQVQTGDLADDAVTAAKILAGTITANEILAGTIDTAQLAAGAVTADKIEANTITAAQIAAGTISATELAADSVTSDKIVARTIQAGDIDTGAITATEIAAGTITANEMATLTLEVGQFIESTSFVPGPGGTGWRLDADGNLEANNGTFRGDIEGSTITGGLFRTADTGERLEIDGTTPGRIDFYSGLGTESGPGFVAVGTNGVAIQSPTISGNNVSLFVDPEGVYAEGVLTADNFKLNNTVGTTEASLPGAEISHFSSHNDGFTGRDSIWHIDFDKGESASLKFRNELWEQFGGGSPSYDDLTVLELENNSGAGTVRVTGDLLVDGNEVYHAGNPPPTPNYANFAGSADNLAGVAATNYARKDTTATQDFAGRLRSQNASQFAPSYSFTDQTNSGMYWNSGIRSLCFASESSLGFRVDYLGQCEAYNLVKFSGRMLGAGMLVSSTSGQTMRRFNDANGEIFAFSSSEKLKENIHDDPEVEAEYVSKLLRLRQPVWDALAEEFDEKGKSKGRKPMSKAKKQRGSYYDRLGPVLEEMAVDFPEAVIFDADTEEAVGLDEALMLSTAILTIQRLVDRLEEAGVLEDGWEQRPTSGDAGTK